MADGHAKEVFRAEHSAMVRDLNPFPESTEFR